VFSLIQYPSSADLMLARRFAITPSELRIAFNATGAPAPQSKHLFKGESGVWQYWGSLRTAWPSIAKIISPDIVTRDGVIHIIDNVEPLHGKTTTVINTNGQKQTYMSSEEKRNRGREFGREE
jgi:hypothetical protein